MFSEKCYGGLENIDNKNRKPTFIDKSKADLTMELELIGLKERKRLVDLKFQEAKDFVEQLAKVGVNNENCLRGTHESATMFTEKAIKSE